MSISSNIIDFKSKLPSHVQLVAISKTKPLSDIEQAYGAGQRVFGENKVQELLNKYEQLPKDISWHFIGHLQTNKVKYIAPFIGLIHAVDSIKLLREINKEGQKVNRKLACLLQVYIANEDTKFGIEPCKIEIFMDEFLKLKLEFVQIKGLMGMASHTTDTHQINEEFKAVNQIFQSIKSKYVNDLSHFDTLSMGMSGDYHIAIAQGSNMVRIGSTLFGYR